MAKYHIQNAPSFDTLREERLFHLWWASKTGYLPVDQKRNPPSNRGAVKQMIADGLLGKKTGCSVPLTEKGRAYMRRYLAAAGDKRLRALIEKAAHDPFLRANYCKQSLEQLISDYRALIETLDRRRGLTA